MIRECYLIYLMTFLSIAEVVQRRLGSGVMDMNVELNRM
jgi:hypothetical protein